MLSRLSEKFTPEELFWLNLYLRSPLPYVKQLYQQLSICDITREDYHTSYYIDFSITQSVPIIDTPCRVPVFIDFCANANFPFLDSKRSKYYNNTGMIHLLDSSENLANRFLLKEAILTIVQFCIFIKELFVNLKLSIGMVTILTTSYHPEVTISKKYSAIRSTISM